LYPMDKKAKSHQEELFYEVEAILARKKSKGRFLYKIKWKGYPLSECTWEPVSHLQYTKDLLDKFNAEMDKVKLGGNSYVNKENENSDNKNKGRKKILQKKSKLLNDDEDYGEKKTMNLKEEEEKPITNQKEKEKEKEKEIKNDIVMNDQRRKLRSSNTKKSEEMLQRELINKIDRPKEKSKNKNRNIPRNKGRFIRKSLSRARPRNKLPQIEKKEEEKKEEKDEEKKEENNLENNTEKKEEKEEEKVNEKEPNPNRKMFYIDEDYRQVLGIKMENQQLIAVVEKKSDDKQKTELLNTKRLKTLNPWILIDYYENRINFE